MYISFNELPDTSRIWIYQCNRFLNEAEGKLLTSKTIDFIENWTAHNNLLQASFNWVDNLFLVIAVNQQVNDASGCSIDKSVHFVQQLEQAFNVHFFDRMQVAIKTDNEIKLMPLHLLSNAPENAKMYDNLIETVGAFKNEWLKPVAQSWAKQFV
ncbi:MAG: ABC transporter ATPase [Bacteroidia bacterium]|nr:ABC transporter ATPase [Bacteroidia bacterium]HQV01247.1 ABC transporter ATPase [Bacteroidia bacterium]